MADASFVHAGVRMAGFLDKRRRKIVGDLPRLARQILNAMVVVDSHRRQRFLEGFIIQKIEDDVWVDIRGVLGSDNDCMEAFMELPSSSSTSSVNTIAIREDGDAKQLAQGLWGRKHDCSVLVS